MDKLYQGAEAVISRDGSAVIKERVRKGYRIKEIDEKLRTRRTRLEARLLRDARRAGVATPHILEEDKFLLKMEFIDGGRVKDLLNEGNFAEIGRLMGKAIAILHGYNIIHGDLTTSNMLLKEGKLYFIDFGLGFTSTRIEDRATDLHVLKEALEAAHFQVYAELWKVIVTAYEDYEKAGEVIKALTKIEKRGRYTEKEKL